jgi:hypothetical protein
MFLLWLSVFLFISSVSIIPLLAPLLRLNCDLEHLLNYLLQSIFSPRSLHWDEEYFGWVENRIQTTHVFSLSCLRRIWRHWRQWFCNFCPPYQQIYQISVLILKCSLHHWTFYLCIHSDFRIVSPVPLQPSRRYSSRGVRLEEWDEAENWICIFIQHSAELWSDCLPFCQSDWHNKSLLVCLTPVTKLLIKSLPDWLTDLTDLIRFLTGWMICLTHSVTRFLTGWMICLTHSLTPFLTG